MRNYSFYKGRSKVLQGQWVDPQAVKEYGGLLVQELGLGHTVLDTFQLRVRGQLFWFSFIFKLFYLKPQVRSVGIKGSANIQ